MKDVEKTYQVGKSVILSYRYYKIRTAQILQIQFNWRLYNAASKPKRIFLSKVALLNGFTYTARH